MIRRRADLKEILEECVSAVLEGRRTIDDCLSLYPQLAPEIEPLLRTATEVSETFEAESPSWHIQERIRLRVLAAHQARVRSRNLVSGLDLRRSAPWRGRHWGLLGAAAAAVVGAVIVASTALSGSGSDGGDVVSVPPAPVEVQPAVMSWADTVEEARLRLQTDGYLGIDFLMQLLERADDVQREYSNPASIDSVDQETREFVQIAIAASEDIIKSLPRDDAEPEAAEAIRDYDDKTKEIAEQFGVAPPTEVPVATGTPAPATPTPEPTDDPSTPAPTPTKAPTPTPAPTPAPTPTPTEAPSSGGSAEDPVAPPGS